LEVYTKQFGAQVAQSVYRLDYGLDNRSSISDRGGEFFSLATAFRLALGPNQPPTQWALGHLSLEIKQPGREAQVKNVWSYTSSPPYVFMEWCLVKYRDNFTFYLYEAIFME
jgi:hypothetical protein